MYRDRIEAYFAQQEPRFIDLLRQLVAVDSRTGDPLPGKPFGEGPARALEVALNLASEMGFHTRNVDNYVGEIDLNQAETRLGILCHLDVVDIGPGWETDPFSLMVKDGFGYGRGSSDDKGPAVASLLAMQAVKDLNIPLQYNARLILGTDEETNCADMNYYLAHEKTPPYVFSPDGKFPVINLEKGNVQPFLSQEWPASTALPAAVYLKGGVRINIVPGTAEALIAGLISSDVQSHADVIAARTGVIFTLTDTPAGLKIDALGKEGHCARPQLGLNALTALIELTAGLPLAASETTDAIRTLHTLFPHGDDNGHALGIFQEDEISGKLTLVLSMLDLNQTGLTGRFDSRTPICANEENSWNVAAARLAQVGIRMEGKFVPPHYTPAESPFVQNLLKVYTDYTGNPGYCEATGGGTYVHHIEGGVSFGADMPDSTPGAHGANEHVCIQDMLTAAKIFTQVIIDICS